MDKITNSFVTTDKDFFSMKEKWNELVLMNTGNSIFLTWEWLYSWWSVYGKGKDLFIILLYKRDELIGIAPFYKDKITYCGIIQFQALKLVGDGSFDSDHLGLISKPGYEHAVALSVVHFFKKTEKTWDFLFFCELPEQSIFYQIADLSFKWPQWHVNQEDVICPYIEIPATWDQYLKTLKPRMRTKVRSLAKKLEKKYTVHFEKADAVHQHELKLLSMFDLHAKRWETKGQRGVFHSENKKNFYYEMSSALSEKGWLRLYSLKVENKYVAHQFCLYFHDRVYLLQEGFEPEWFKDGVGNVLRSYVIKDCIENKIDVYDFLAGLSFHKESWGTKNQCNKKIVVGRLTARLHVYLFIQSGFEKTKQRIKEALPERSVERFKTIYQWIKTRF